MGPKTASSIFSARFKRPRAAQVAQVLRHVAEIVDQGCNVGMVCAQVGFQYRQRARCAGGVQEMLRVKPERSRRPFGFSLIHHRRINGKNNLKPPAAPNGVPVSWLRLGDVELFTVIVTQPVPESYT